MTTSKQEQGYVTALSRPQCSNCAALLKVDRRARHKNAELPFRCAVGGFEVSLTGLCNRWVAHPKARDETRRFAVLPF